MIKKEVLNEIIRLSSLITQSVLDGNEDVLNEYRNRLNDIVDMLLEIKRHK